jgi:hypothetical protein
MLFDYLITRSISLGGTNTFEFALGDGLLKNLDAGAGEVHGQKPLNALFGGCF